MKHVHDAHIGVVKLRQSKPTPVDEPVLRSKATGSRYFELQYLSRESLWSLALAITEPFLVISKIETLSGIESKDQL
jgi:hypothetical protein